MKYQNCGLNKKRPGIYISQVSKKCGKLFSLLYRSNNKYKVYSGQVLLNPTCHPNGGISML